MTVPGTIWEGAMAARVMEEGCPDRVDVLVSFPHPYVSGLLTITREAAISLREDLIAMGLGDT